MESTAARFSDLKEEIYLLVAPLDLFYPFTH